MQEHLANCLSKPQLTYNGQKKLLVTDNFRLHTVVISCNLDFISKIHTKSGYFTAKIAIMQFIHPYILEYKIFIEAAATFLTYFLLFCIVLRSLSYRSEYVRHKLYDYSHGKYCNMLLFICLDYVSCVIVEYTL